MKPTLALKQKIQEVPDFPGANRGRDTSRSSLDACSEVLREVDLWERWEADVETERANIVIS